MTTVGEAWIDIKTRLSGGATSSSGDADLNAQLERAGRAAAGAMAAGFASKKLFDFGKQALDAIRESEKIGHQTDAVLASTAAAAKVTADEVGNLANEISKKTGVDDEAIQTGENLLLTFTNIRNEQGAGNDIFSQATKLMVDYGAAMGGDASSGALMLGKALNDPIAGMTALQRAGVQFSASQKSTIETFIAQGRLLEAQKVIIAEVSRQFGGSAEAQATSADKAAVAWGNLQERIGEGVVPVVDAAASVMLRLLDGVEALPGPVEQVVFGATGLAAVVVGVGKGVELWTSAQAVLSDVLDKGRAVLEARKVVTEAVAAADAVAATQLTLFTAAEGVEATVAAASADAKAIQAGQQTLFTVATEAGTVAQLEFAAAETVATGAAAAFNPVLLGVLAATAAVTVAVMLFRDKKDEQKDAIERVSKALVNEQGELDNSRESLDKWISTNSRFEGRNQIDDIDRLGLTYKQLTDLLESGSTGYDTFARKARDAGELVQVHANATGNLVDANGKYVDSTRGVIEIDGKQFAGNLDLIESFRTEQKALQESSRLGADELKRRELVTQAMYDQAVATNTAKNGTVDWVLVNRELSGQLATASGVVAGYSGEVDAATAALFNVATAQKVWSDQLGASHEAAFGASDAQRSFEDSLKSTETASGGASKSADSYAKKLQGQEDAVRGLKDATDALADAELARFLISLGPNADEVTKAKIKAQQAEREVARAFTATSEAQNKRNAAIKSGSAQTKAEEIATAQLAAEGASINAAKARDAVTDAEIKYQKALDTRDDEGIRKGQIALNEAQLKVKTTQAASIVAERDLTEARGYSSAATNAYTEASLDLQDAQDRQTLAGIAAREAQAALTAVQNAGKEGSKELATANDAVEAAERRVEQSQRAVIDANNAFTESAGRATGAAKSVDEQLSTAAKNGQAWIQFLIDQKRPASEIAAALADIHTGLSGIAGQSPEAASRAEDFFNRITYAAGGYAGALDRIATASAMATTGLDPSKPLPDALVALNAWFASITGRAAGGPASGWTMVGENGRELVNLPDGSYVNSNAATEQIAGRGGGGVRVSIPISVQVNAPMSEGQAKAVGESLAGGMRETFAREIGSALRAAGVQS